MTQQRLDDSNIGVALKQVGRKAMAQRMQRHALLDPGGVGRLVEQPVELPGRRRLAGSGAGKQPTLLRWHARVRTRWASLPPRPQQTEHLGRQHHVAVLAALGLLDANDILRLVDMLDLQPHHFAGAQTTAIAETEQCADLEVAGDGQQTPRLILAHHQRDLLRLADVINLGGQVQSPQRHAQQELQPGHDAVAIANAYTSLGQVQLETADVIRCGRVGRSLEKRSETFAAPDVASLRARTELTRVHVFDHALAQRADSSRTHRQLLSWMRFTTPRSSRQSDPHAIDDLSSSCRTRVRATRAAGYRAAI